jgi:hypothetical protein
LGSFHFARRYFGNHCCFLFLEVLRCFSSLRSPHPPMYSADDAPGLTRAGCPIQRSPDQSLFSSSPKLIAAYHVFHRLLAPRHPPTALNSLATKKLAQTTLTSASLISCYLSKLSKSNCVDQPLARSMVPCPRSRLLVVEVNGFEPMASCVQGRRSPS